MIIYLHWVSPIILRLFSECRLWSRFIWQSAVDLVKRMYKLMISTDATMVEINPLAETNDGR